jgi:hypothetical protein
MKVVLLFFLLTSSVLHAMQSPPAQQIIGAKKTPYDLVERNFAERLGDCCCDHSQNPRCPNPCGCVGCACASAMAGMGFNDACRYFLGYAQNNAATLIAAAASIVAVTAAACCADQYSIDRKRNRFYRYQRYLEEEKRKDALAKLQDTYPSTDTVEDKKTS